MAKSRQTTITICGGKLSIVALCLLFNMLAIAHGMPAAAQTLMQSVEQLESQSGAGADARLTLPERVAALERHVLGAPQDGPLVGRIENLKQAVARHESNGRFPLEEPVSIDETVSSQDTGPYLTDSLPLLNAIPPNFLRIEPPQASSATGDYYPEVIAAGKGKVFHFKTMPIPVYINSFPDRNFLSCVLRGFETWQDRSSGAVRFVQVDDAKQARIQLVWKRLGRDRDDAGCLVGAHTITRYTQHSKGSVALFAVGGVPVPMYIPKFGPRYTVPPQVIEVNLDMVMTRHPSIRYRLLQNVVTHELGHALGLLGHSRSTLDMMYPVTDEHSRLSQHDLNTLLKLYQHKADVPL